MLAIVSHDAGGAELLSSYVARDRPNCLFTLDGPARRIFERKLGPIVVSPLGEAVSQADNILCGSSWQSDLEFNAIKLARVLGKPCAVFLDHWVNYAERFTRSGVTCLPDEIWVGDEHARQMAENIFSGLPICLVENPYLKDIRNDLDAITPGRRSCPEQLSVLYVCEPIREHALMQYGDERYWGYTEEDALRYFLSNVGVLNGIVERIVVRPHPSECFDKYIWMQDEFGLTIVAGGSHSLIEEIAQSDVVVGCESMALVVGLLAGKRVISCIPPGGRVCALPQREIQHLQKLL